MREFPASAKRASTLFLKVVIVLIAIGMLAALLWEPHLEGRNAHATLFAIYFKDPFLAYVYIGSIPFFVALHQAFRVLTYIGRNETFSQRSVQAVRTIQYCMLITAGMIVSADAYLMIAAHGEDDPAGAVMLGMVAAFLSLVIAAAAAVLERILQNAMEGRRV